MHTDLAFAPYGEQYSVSGGVGVAGASFAGNNEDTRTNLYDAQFREYGIQGRWPSPDPAGIAAANPANPQSWNRYAYVLNNPLLFIDPTGLHLVCMAGEMYDVFDYSVNGEYSGTEYDDMGPWPVGNSGGSLVFTGDGGGGGSSSGGPVLTNPDPKQLATLQTLQQACMSSFQNSTAGKVVQFGSLLSFFDNAWSTTKEWTAAFVIKGGYVKIAETAGQSLQSAGEITPVTTVAKPLVGTAATIAVGFATGLDANQRARCAGLSDPNAAITLTTPIFFP